jgi:phage terminase large subunit-like protein
MAVSRQARKVEQFIQEMPYTSGRWVGEPFNLIGWQRDLIRKIFGTIRPDGLRQYRKVYLEIPKKNGKTEFAAAIANYMAFADDEPTPEVYFVSGDKEQASIAFNAADYMIQNTGLKNLSKTTKSIKRIDIPQRNGVLRVMSAEAKLKHGYRPSAIIADEVHIWPQRSVLGAARLRRQGQGRGDQ